MKKNLKISKMDAARRQLETVIRLYFCTGDPVSIHSLTSGSYNIIRDINKNQGGPPLLMKEDIINYVKPEHEKEVRKIINAAENFFKHADRDQDEVLDFNPDQSELLILEACSMYYKLTGEFPPLFKLFQSWYIANHKNMFTFSEEKQIVISKTAQKVIELGREGYFQTFLPILMHIATI
jgi:hypothetical protein